MTVEVDSGEASLGIGCMFFMFSCIENQGRRRLRRVYCAVLVIIYFQENRSCGLVSMVTCDCKVV